MSGPDFIDRVLALIVKVRQNGRSVSVAVTQHAIRPPIGSEG
jgi:hypothetical protein